MIATLGMLAKCIAIMPIYKSFLTDIRFLVFDDADKLFNSPFKQELDIVQKRNSSIDIYTQTLLFSTSINSSMKKFQKIMLQNAYFYKAYFSLQITNYIVERYIFLSRESKKTYLYCLLKKMENDANSLRANFVY